jgi:large subunit ribosomal protein L21
MYAIVTTGGKQYRVEQGQSLLVERLPVEDGATATLRPLLYVDGDNVVDGDGLAKVSVEARVLGHERGPKLRVVKFKPKRGYKRRTGHRQELTRIEVTAIKLAERRQAARRTPKPVAAKEEAAGGEATTAARTKAPAAVRAPDQEAHATTGATEAAATETQAEAAATEAHPKPTRSRRKPRASKPEPEEGNGA